MIEFYAGKVRISLSFTFFALIAAVTAAKGFRGMEIIIVLFCCILHELGHIIVMCMLGVPPEAVMFYAGGIKITPDKSRMLSKAYETAVLSGGCAVNFLMFAVSLAVKGSMSYFASANLLLAAFNLLPLKYFDGGRILSGIIGERGIETVRAIVILLLALLLIIMIQSGRSSISLLITFFYIAISEIAH